tara:strand:- start:622 stop:2271 length:1650 start_codon:yes stop_codon:yes gene_type:complete
MKILLFCLSITLVFSEKVDYDKIGLGVRGDVYRIWIYFKDKSESEMTQISAKSFHRRAISGVQSMNLWYDLNLTSAYKEEILRLGLKIENESRWLNAISVLCEKTDFKKIIAMPFVKKIEPVIGYKKLSYEHSKQINNNFRELDYGYAQSQIEQINVHELHNAGYTGVGVRILVMDTGFNLTHTALENINVISQWDVINDDNETANETSTEIDQNQDYHGTAVLSTIAANAPGDLIGVAFDAEFLLAKTEDVTQEVQLEEDNYVAGLEWGEANGADIVSTSLGYLDWYTYGDMDGNTAVTTNAIDIAAGLGLICVTAAGNEGNDDWNYIIAPADADSVIAVGAVRENGQIASFSSHGPTFDGRIKPEVCARGVSTSCISPNSTSAYTNLSGTSLACPLVAGAVALVRQAQPDWTAMQLREAVLMTSSRSEIPDNEYGYGIMDAAAAIEYNITANVEDGNIIPSEFHMLTAYPNPFNPAITVQVYGDPGSHLKVQIYSLNGKRVVTLYEGILFRKTEKLIWVPDHQASGIFLVKSHMNGRSNFKKITYLK